MGGPELQTSTQTGTKKTTRYAENPKDVLDSHMHAAIDDTHGPIEDKELAKHKLEKMVERDVKPDRWRDIMQFLKFSVSILGGGIGVGGIVKLIIHVRFQNIVRENMKELLELAKKESGAKFEINGDTMNITLDTKKA